MPKALNESWAGGPRIGFVSGVAATPSDPVIRGASGLHSSTGRQVYLDGIPLKGRAAV